jgi:hypothetical protein
MPARSTRQHPPSNRMRYRGAMDDIIDTSID